MSIHNMVYTFGKFWVAQRSCTNKIGGAGIGKLAFGMLCVLLSIFALVGNASAAVLFAEHFETSANWDGRTSTSGGYGYISAPIDSTVVGKWEYVRCGTQNDNSHGAISADYGHTGKGFMFKITPMVCGAPSTAQESNMTGGMSLNQATLFWGFRYRQSTVSSTDLGSTRLKMTRFYSGSSSIIPEWIGTEWNMYYNGTNHMTGYVLPDTNWHKFVFEFQKGTGANGVIRMWVDDVLEYQNLTVSWGGSGSTFTYANSFPIMQGNISGDYSGPVLYTYWDDYIWATTKGEVDEFLGASRLNPPSNFKIH